MPFLAYTYRSVAAFLDAKDVEGVVLTWFCEGDEVGDVLHEDAAFELEFRFAAFVDELFVGELVLGFGEVNVLAAEEDGFEEVDMVLPFHMLAVLSTTAQRSNGMIYIRIGERKRRVVFDGKVE